MAWTAFQIFIAIGMVISGSISTISFKWCDETKSQGRDGTKRYFKHPFQQVLFMFVGQVFCFFLYKTLYFYYNKKNHSASVNSLTKGNQDFNVFILLIPSMCDLTATSILYFGLTLTHASSYQMLRGSVIVFVAILSAIFLHHKITIRKGCGILIIVLGLVLVGLSEFLFNVNGKKVQKKSLRDVAIGDALVVIGEIFAAVHMVVEEKYVFGLDINALQTIGWEGIFGFIVLGILQIPMFFIIVEKNCNKPKCSIEDSWDGFVQMYHHWHLIVGVLAGIIAISFLNFFGVSVTKELSATTRMVLDSIRIIVIWIYSLLFDGQEFRVLQLIGFLLLLLGMCLYNGIISKKNCSKCRKKCCPCCPDKSVDEEKNYPSIESYNDVFPEST